MIEIHENQKVHFQWYKFLIFNKSYCALNFRNSIDYQAAKTFFSLFIKFKEYDIIDAHYSEALTWGNNFGKGNLNWITHLRILTNHFVLYIQSIVKTCTGASMTCCVTTKFIHYSLWQGYEINHPTHHAFTHETKRYWTWGIVWHFHQST